MTIWRMRIACWIPEATNTPSEYVILTAFPLQQCLHERASLLRYTYIACLVFACFFVCMAAGVGPLTALFKRLSSWIKRMCIRFRQNETTDYRIFHRNTVLLHNYELVHGNTWYVVEFTSEFFSNPRKIFKRFFNRYMCRWTYNWSTAWFKKMDSISYVYISWTVCEWST